MMENNKVKSKTLGVLVWVVILSFVVGSAAGAIFGTLAANKIFGYQVTSGSFNFFKSLKPSETPEGTTSPTPKTQTELTVEQAVAKALPSVVSIVITKDLSVYEQYFYNPFADDPFFRQFFGDIPQFQIPGQRPKGTEKQQVGAGSGFIVSSDGLMVTNKHVVADQEAEYTVVTNEGKKYPAQVLARDPVNDLAIIKIEASGLRPIDLGDSSKLRLGQTVVAIGNALGEFRNTISTGVVSGLSRSVTASGGGIAEQLAGLIQTDAAINPGNSGGPLIDLAGRVIGVNTAMATGAQNIGFAIPINDVKKAIESVKKTGKISRPYLGIRYLMLNEELAKQKNLAVDYGALIIKGESLKDLAVIPDSPAAKAGLEEGDIILEMNGKKLDEQNPLFLAITRFSAGEEITLKVLSKGQEKTVKVILGERE